MSAQDEVTTIVLEKGCKPDELEQESVNQNPSAGCAESMDTDYGDFDQFAYIASHDLREPLRGITTHIKFLNHEELSEPAQDRIARIGELARHADALISDLLLFSRIRAGNGQVTNTGSLFSDIESSFDIFADRTAARLVVQRSLPHLKMSRAHATTMFSNLIANGLTFNANNPRLVEISAKPDSDNMVWFFVKDNGIGIEPKYHARVFNIFTHLHPRKTYQSGTGSGLAMVEKIVRLHGGSLSIRSAPESGTTICTCLPCA